MKHDHPKSPRALAPRVAAELELDYPHTNHVVQVAIRHVLDSIRRELLCGLSPAFHRHHKRGESCRPFCNSNACRMVLELTGEALE